MKVTKAQVEANRAHIVDTACTLFRERGYDGVGVAELMATAGLTHGGFYRHFGSKAELMAEAAACGVAKTQSLLDGVNMADFIGHYVSREHRDDRSGGCTLAALCGDAARQPEAIKTTFATGLESILTDLLGDESAGTAQARRDARPPRVDGRHPGTGRRSRRPWPATHGAGVQVSAIAQRLHGPVQAR